MLLSINENVELSVFHFGNVTVNYGNLPVNYQTNLTGNLPLLNLP